MTALTGKGFPWHCCSLMIQLMHLIELVLLVCIESHLKQRSIIRLLLCFTQAVLPTGIKNTDCAYAKASTTAQTYQEKSSEASIVHNDSRVVVKVQYQRVEAQ
mmetsp:Transcript_20542/g.38942  ORF Transcript_20542/g.38942 Transcript_20542/m.38942 type:complete len:103 (-) Transcript_20542:33-341(-)